MNDMPHRSALADYLTILTGLFTILSGAYSLYAGGDVSAAADTETYWDGPLRHAIAINGSFFNTERMVGQYVSKAYFR